MKITQTLILFSISIQIFAQTIKNQPRTLSPITGHYKTLSMISGKATSDTTDRMQFGLEDQSPKDALKLKLKPQYLTLPASEFVIPEFPANSSKQTKAEIEYLPQLQATARSEEKVKESLEFANVYYNVFVKETDATYPKMQSNLFHMGRQIGWFTPENLPKTASLMTKVWSDATYYFWALKFKYNRIRPYKLDPRIINLNNTNFQAYPSGHASASYVAAFIYQELLPEKKDLFIKNAYDMAYSREIIGVHYPSDSEAGRIFGRQFVNELLKNETFLKEFNEVKKEINSIKNQNK